MARTCAILPCVGGPLRWSAFAVPAAVLAAVLATVLTNATAAATAEPARWRWETAAGFDATVHTYALAVDDTTETISEFMLEAALEGRSDRSASRRWRLRADASAGTELYRQRVDGDWRLLGDGGHTPVRVDGGLAARQYRRGTEYVYSSDSWEGRLDVRTQPVAWPGALLEVRARGGLQDYRTPSTLEVDWRQAAAGLYLRSRRPADRWWSVGVGALRRTYPDTAAIDRDQLGLELDWDSGALGDGGLRLHHKSERREVADETARPSAWSHWTDLAAAVPAGPGRVVAEVQSEVWRYDTEDAAWFDSWRLDGLLGYRWGDILAASWLVGLAAERLDAGDNPDSYRQWGARAGVDAFGLGLSGSLTVEYGHRDYLDPAITLDADGLTETFGLYSDFAYWKVWLTGSWRLAAPLTLEALASWEPERHTEQADDSSLGFATLRLVWRP
ncbi:MAG: hypothetical protein ABR506_06905 [Candidatus Krumholzibacteriia bacterium]